MRVTARCTALRSDATLTAMSLCVTEPRLDTASALCGRACTRERESENAIEMPGTAC